MSDAFQYPPEVFNLLVDTIPLLCRSKQNVILFLRGAGVAQEDLTEVESSLRADRNAINKFDIVRNVLTKLNARGDSGLRPRRELLKRTVEFESFETCWPTDQYKAKGLVASIREAVDAKDSFTRMRQEREAEREVVLDRQRAKQVAVGQKRAKIEAVSKRLSALFAMDDKPQERGKLLEAVLNDLFKAYEILVREDFRRRDTDNAVVLEQVDGVIELDGTIHLVEMKWLKDPVGVAEFGPHLVRIFGRANASGIFISNSGYTEPVIKQCAEFLNQRTTFLCSLQELVMLLQRQDDLLAFLKRKAHAAIIDKKPFLEILF
ncbi:restriction endonuclease [Rhodanobacter glycinis]|uniref:restriction endonuclease n=1 Tax=Rhodanobacter glycinis TaxID=582702 RepID=UPI0011286C3F|nr:restriction endonuclease [Rhodanobacter glycinis]TPG50275.1 restriction endonuclease [Rhodanobacter glycinis]